MSLLCPCNTVQDQVPEFLCMCFCQVFDAILFLLLGQLIFLNPHWKCALVFLFHRLNLMMQTKDNTQFSWQLTFATDLKLSMPSLSPRVSCDSHKVTSRNLYWHWGWGVKKRSKVTVFCMHFGTSTRQNGFTVKHLIAILGTCLCTAYEFNLIVGILRQWQFQAAQ